MLASVGDLCFLIYVHAYPLKTTSEGWSCQVQGVYQRHVSISFEASVLLVYAIPESLMFSHVFLSSVSAENKMFVAWFCCVSVCVCVCVYVCVCVWCVLSLSMQMYFPLDSCFFVCGQLT